MPALLITYDLNKPGQNYSALYEAIKALGTAWARPLESVWIVITDDSCSEARDELSVHIDGNDQLLVVPLDSGWATRKIPKKITGWMHQNL